MRAPTVTLLSLALWLVSATTMAATVYKWVDEQGVTHFSDQPHPNAKEVEVRAQPTVGSVATSASTAAKPAAEASGPAYTRCELFRPENDEVFLNTSTVTAKLRLEPQLQPGDQVAIAIDGKRVLNQPMAASEFVLTDIERGTHSVFVGVYDRAGKQLCATSPVTFHVRQPSAQAPVKSLRPRF